jgi:hypothetical protein
MSSIASVDFLDQRSPTGAGINTPELTVGSTKPKRRAISDVSHLFRIISNLQEARREQNAKNARIAAKINNERPHSDSQLESEGLGYKSNVSTKPLSTTISKVTNRLVKSIQSARYLTSAALPDSVPGAREKSEMFQNEVTNLIRRWPEWFDSISQLATEDGTFGWAVAAWTDTSEWRPKIYRQDDVLLPDGTGHSPSTAQVCGLRRFLQMHELAEMIEDRKAAEMAGWNIENTIESINNARPPSVTGDTAAPHTDARRREDALRESSVSASLLNGAKQIEVYDVLAVEIDGQISHYIVDHATKKLLFEKEDRFENAADCLAFFSFEHGNGKLMASKGVGREIYEIAGALDRASNEAIDRLQMSGKIIVTGPESLVDRFKLTVIGNVAIVPEGFTVSQTKIESGIKEFQILRETLRAQLDEISGSVSPKEFDRERVTTAEVNAYTAREEERRDDRDTRFIMQVAQNLVGPITRRALSAKQTDKEAKKVREKLLRYMTEDELQTLVDTPPIQTIEDFTELKAQQLAMFADAKRGDPLYNQRKLQSKAASALFDAEFADDVLLPENDPTEMAEQIRGQLLENLVLAKKIPVPVSRRDNHLLHIEAIKQTIQPLIEACASGDANALSVVQFPLEHWAAHLAEARNSGVDSKVLAPLEQELKGAATQIGELQAHAEASAQQQQAGGAPLPPIDAEQPPAPPAPPV